MNLLKDLSEDELKNKIEELNDPFLSYAYVKELEQRQEPVSLKRIVTLLHDEAEKLEKQGLTQGKIGNTHAMHGKMDTARCFRITANTLIGDQAG